MVRFDSFDSWNFSAVVLRGGYCHRSSKAFGITEIHWYTCVRVLQNIAVLHRNSGCLVFCMCYMFILMLSFTAVVFTLCCCHLNSRGAQECRGKRHQLRGARMGRRSATLLIPVAWLLRHSPFQCHFLLMGLWKTASQHRHKQLLTA